MALFNWGKKNEEKKTASREAKDIAQSLIRLEDQLVKDMRPYL